MADRCRSCDAPIEWAPTSKGSRMPLDVGLHDDGSIALDGHGIAYVTDDRPARRSHFQTCPNAGAHRRKQARR